MPLASCSTTRSGVCGTAAKSVGFVGLMAKLLRSLRRESSAEIPHMRKVTRNGTTYMMATADVGGRPQQEAEPIDQQPVPPRDEVAEKPERDKEGGETVDVADEPATIRTPGQGQTAEQGRFSVVVVASTLHSVGELPIPALPVGDYAAPDAVLWMWTTTRQLPHALATIRQWGFEYADLLTWVKRPSR